MANTSLLQVRTSAEDKEKASAILEKLGTNLSAVVNMLIKQIIITEGIPFEVKMGRPVYSFRDVQKLYAAMTDGKMGYVLYGAENQAEIHYAMPVKNNLYDALEFAGQVEEAAKSHRKEMKRKKEEGEGSAEDGGKTPSAGEFLSGFWVEDRLIPSITVTIFFGSEEWDGPLSLFEMMDVSDPDVLACMDNYHVRLIAPAQMTDEVVNVCQAIQEMKKEERQIGELNKAKEAAKNFYNLGIDVEKIAQGVGYAVETVKEWLGLES